MYQYKGEKNMIDVIKTMIGEICQELSIDYKFVSKDWVLILEKEGKTKFVAGYKFDLNEHAMGLIADDKYALYEVLKYKNIPVIEHEIVYPPSNHLQYATGCNTYAYVKDYFKKHYGNIVIKPNDGTCGHHVFHVTDIQQIDSILDKLFESHSSISICPFYDIKYEYRIVVLNGKAKLLYEKHLPCVIGDGNKSIRELLLEFNGLYFKDKLKDSKYDKVLKNQEKFQYDWRFNLSCGSVSKKIEEEEIRQKLILITERLLKQIPLKFGSIDIIRTVHDEFFVLEVNSGVMLDHYMEQNQDSYNQVKEIYKEAIKSLFYE